MRTPGFVEQQRTGDRVEHAGYGTVPLVVHFRRARSEPRLARRLRGQGPIRNDRRDTAIARSTGHRDAAVRRRFLNVPIGIAMILAAPRVLPETPGVVLLVLLVRGEGWPGSAA